MKFSDIYIVRSRSAPVVIPETFAPKVGFSSTVLVPWIGIFKTTQKFKSSPGYAELQMLKNLWFHFEGNSGTQIHVVSSCGSCGNTVKVVKSEVSLKLRINFARTKLTDNMTPLLSWKDKNNFFVIIHFAPFMVILWPACGLYLWHSCTALVWIWPHIVTEVVCLCRWVCFDFYRFLNGLVVRKSC